MAMSDAVELAVSRVKGFGNWPASGDSVNVTSRVGKCRCGCGGKDSWHATRFTRVLRDVTEVRETATPTWLNTAVSIVARGTVKVPWGAADVGLVVIECGARAVVNGWSIIQD